MVMAIDDLSLFKVHTNKRTQVYSVQFSLAVTHPRSSCLNYSVRITELALVATEYNSNINII